jgi:hypothetical protein
MYFPPSLEVTFYTRFPYPLSTDIWRAKMKHMICLTKEKCNKYAALGQILKYRMKNDKASVLAVNRRVVGSSPTCGVTP